MKVEDLIKSMEEYKKNNLQDVTIEEYISTHINEEHDYSCANDERDYDICLYCDCKRYVNSNDWVVDE